MYNLGTEVPTVASLGDPRLRLGRGTRIDGQWRNPARKVPRLAREGGTKSGARLAPALPHPLPDWPLPRAFSPHPEPLGPPDLLGRGFPLCWVVSPCAGCPRASGSGTPSSALGRARIPTAFARQGSAAVHLAHQGPASAVQPLGLPSGAPLGRWLGFRLVARLVRPEHCRSASVGYAAGSLASGLPVSAPPSLEDSNTWVSPFGLARGASSSASVGFPAPVARVDCCVVGCLVAGSGARLPSTRGNQGAP